MRMTLKIFERFYIIIGLIDLLSTRLDIQGPFKVIKESVEHIFLAC